MAFLDNSGVTTLVTRLKTYFALKNDVPGAFIGNPKMDGTASAGTGTTYARGNHVHPHDTSKQDVLVSGTNIKTINGESLLGSGDITVGGGGGSSGLVLNITENSGTYTLDKTVSEIVEALNSGISPVFISTGDDGGKNYYQLASVSLTLSTWDIKISCTGYSDVFAAVGASAYPSFTRGGEEGDGIKSISISPAISTTPALESAFPIYWNEERADSDGWMELNPSFHTDAPLHIGEEYTFTITPTPDWHLKIDDTEHAAGESVSVTRTTASEGALNDIEYEVSNNDASKGIYGIIKIFHQ